MQYSAILLVMVTHSLPQDHPNSASSSSWHLELLWQHKAQSQLGSACRSRTAPAALTEADVPALAPSGLAQQPPPLPLGHRLPQPILSHLERSYNHTVEYLSSLWLSWEHWDSLQDPSTCSHRQKCFSQGISLKKYLNICSLLYCCVKRHQKKPIKEPEHYITH